MARLRLLELCDHLDAVHGSPTAAQSATVAREAATLVRWAHARRRSRRDPLRFDWAHLVLDRAALADLMAGGWHARCWVRWMAQRGGTVIVPAAVLADAVAEANGYLPAFDRVLLSLVGPAGPVPVDAPTAVLAGHLRRRAEGAGADTVDALVAAAALRTGGPAVVLTARPVEIDALLRGHPRVTAVRVADRDR